MQFRDPEFIAQSMVLNPAIQSEIDQGTLVPKPFSALCAVPVRCEIGKFKSDEKNITLKEDRELMSIDSQTKSLTASALLRATEENGFKDYIPSLDKHLSEFLPLLKEYYPDSKYIKEDLEQDPNFSKITLKDLLLHTSGLLRVKEEYFPELLTQKPHQKLTETQILDAQKIQRTNQFGESHGQYCYNNIDYELAKAVLLAVANKVKKERKNYTDIVDELVISRVKDKLQENGKGELVDKIYFFGTDKIQTNPQGFTTVEGWHGTISDKQKCYFTPKKTGDTDQELSASYQAMPSYLYDQGAGGAYTTPYSLSVTMFHVLNNDEKFSVFKDRDTLKKFNETQISTSEQGKLVGMGYFSYAPPYDHLRYHNGSGYGSCSSTFVDLQNNQSFSVLMTHDNLVLPIAYALSLADDQTQNSKNIKHHYTNNLIKLDENLLNKTAMLKTKFNEEQLLALRNELEKTNSLKEFIDNFQEKHPQTFTEIQAKPRSWVDRTKASLDSEKFSSKTR